MLPSWYLSQLITSIKWLLASYTFMGLYLNLLLWLNNIPFSLKVIKMREGIEVHITLPRNLLLSFEVNSFLMN